MGATYVIGTGGIGLFLQHVLQDAVGSILLAREGTRAVLAREPLRVTGTLEGERSLHVEAWEALGDLAADDTVFVATGSHDALTVLERLSSRIADGTRVVMCQNAIGMHARAVEALPQARHVRLHNWLGSHKRGPAHIDILGIFKVDLAGSDADALATWQGVFEGAGIHATAGDDPAHAEWTKALWTIALHGICTLADAPIGIVQADPAMERLARALMAEAVAAAAAEGLALRDQDVNDVIQWVAAAPQLRNATLRDLEAGRPHDLGWFNGAVVEVARRHGVPAPLNEAVLALVDARQAERAKAQNEKRAQEA